MICGPILKCRKWVGRSKILSEVNLNMVYGVPIWKQENFYQGALRSKFDAPFSEPCIPCGPLVGNFNKRHLILMGRAHRFRICTIFFFLRQVLAAGEGPTGEKFNLPNTCPKWTSGVSLECHLPADHEYITFFSLGPVFRPEFSTRISKMAATDSKLDLDGGRHFESMGAAIFFCLRMRVRMCTPKSQIALIVSYVNA